MCVCMHSPEFTSLIHLYRKSSWASTLLCKYQSGVSTTGEHDINLMIIGVTGEIQGAIRLNYREGLDWLSVKISNSAFCTFPKSWEFSQFLLILLPAKGKKTHQSPYVAGAVSHLANIHFSFLLILRTLIFFRTVMCPAEKPHFLTCPAAGGGRGTSFWPKRCKQTCTGLSGKDLLFWHRCHLLLPGTSSFHQPRAGKGGQRWIEQPVLVRTPQGKQSHLPKVIEQLEEPRDSDGTVKPPYWPK